MTRLTTLTAVAALAAGMAMAQDAFSPGAEFMLAWDLDSDGFVTLAEVRERRDSIFYMFDIDGDDQYSATELAGVDAHKAEEAANGKGVGQRGSGRLQGRAAHQGQGFAQAPGAPGAEIQPGQGRATARGRMTQTSLLQPGAAQTTGRGGRWQQVQPVAPQGQVAPLQRGARGQGQAQHRAAPQQGAGRGQALAQHGAGVTGAALVGSATELLAYDTDGNGIITRAEYVNGAAPWFAQRDRNGDGAITPDDFGNGRL